MNTAQGALMILVFAGFLLIVLRREPRHTGGDSVEKAAGSSWASFWRQQAWSP